MKRLRGPWRISTPLQGSPRSLAGTHFKPTCLVSRYKVESWTAQAGVQHARLLHLSTLWIRLFRRYKMLLPSCSGIFCHFQQVYMWFSILGAVVLTCVFPYLVRTCHWYHAVDGWPGVGLSWLVGWREQDGVPVYHLSVNLKQDVWEIFRHAN